MDHRNIFLKKSFFWGGEGSDDEEKKKKNETRERRVRKISTSLFLEDALVGGWAVSFYKLRMKLGVQKSWSERQTLYSTTPLDKGVENAELAESMYTTLMISSLMIQSPASKAGQDIFPTSLRTRAERELHLLPRPPVLPTPKQGAKKQPEAKEILHFPACYEIVAPWLVISVILGLGLRALTSSSRPPRHSSAP